MRDQFNRRKETRKKCAVPVEGKTGLALDTAKTVDISTGGVGFLSRKSIPLDKKIALEIDVSPGEEPVLLMGQVKWVSRMGTSSRYRVGMKFTNVLYPGSRTLLNRYFRSKRI